MFDYIYYSIFGYCPYYNQISSNIDWANVIAVLLSGIIGAFGAIYVGNKNNRLQQDLVKKQIIEQQKQWKYDVIIRKEMDDIVKLYYMLCDADDAFHWFMWSFLSPFGEYPNIYHNTTQEAFLRECFVKYWNKINEINKVLNSNLLIYKKYHIASKVQIIRSILSLIEFLPINDFHVIYQDGTQQYRLEKQDDIRFKFVKEANNILKKAKIDGYNSDINEEDLLREYSYIWHMVNDLLLKNKENIEKIIIGYDNQQIPEEENIGIKKFMPETEVK